MRPSEVRLQPSEKDAYTWTFSNATSHLFEKQLSDVSTNIYIELSNGIECGEILAMSNEPTSSSFEFRTTTRDLEAETYNLEEQLKEANASISKLETEIEGFKRRQATLLCENKRLRQAFFIYLRKARSIGRCLGDTERQIHDFLNSIKLNKQSHVQL